jgi:hypothetical protein
VSFCRFNDSTLKPFTVVDRNRSALHSIIARYSLLLLFLVYCLVSSLLFGIVPGLVLNLPPSFVVLAHLSLSSSRCCPQSVNAAASCRGRSEGFVSSNRSPKKIQDAQRVRSNVRSRIQQSPCLARCCIAHNPRCYRQAAIMVNGEKRSQKELRTSWYSPYSLQKSEPGEQTVKSDGKLGQNWICSFSSSSSTLPFKSEIRTKNVYTRAEGSLV